MLKLDSKIHRVEVVHTGPELVAICAQLRADCAAIGHALAQREHNADRWIAATAIRLGIPLVSKRHHLQGRTRPHARIAHVTGATERKRSERPRTSSRGPRR
jgi:hypothetical protein